ncbi:tripeptidyl-peptidase-like protein [Zopfia rhizophila CBS 207.26]|uniref:tripeptidyl-peptidase II n=1 Tax=Zopfia rhizophila CBS 207.26 TaxID=1314779 RepID=A0A6A6EV90_9PEZI|nr:tripeptidyl-peptidase-like protein [Zopfia rhizophila CBS 207.26]
MRFSTLAAGLLFLVGGANCASTSHIEPMEKLRTVPEGWKEIGAPAQDRRLHFRIAVHQPNHDLFEQTLMEISTPNHPRYGQHLKRHELKELIKPRAESTDAVLKWLKDSGVPSEDIENDGEWINFLAPVSTAEKMMDTKFKTYESLVRKDIRKIRALQYSVPKELLGHIDMIQPTTRFGQIRPQINHIIDKEIIGTGIKAAAVNESCNTQITPQCLKDLYNFADFKADPNAPTLVGVTGYLEEYARFKDFADFARLFAPWAVGSNFTWTSVNGGILDQRSTNDSVEANLDIQYTAGLISPGIKTNYYSTPNRGPLVPDLDQPTPEDNQNEPYLEFFTYLVGLPDGQLPQVLTTSYGEDEQSVPEEYSKKVCDMIGQLGTRGVSVLFSSGDTGVGSACQTNDGKNTTRFLPIFPASCPYVTSVGGTYQIPEQAIYFSSGGFSDRWARPSYQDAAVGEYLKKLGSQWEGLYNPNGRGFPDVAAQGARFRVVDKGTQISVGGTSASAPAFASVVALLNNARISAGKPPLGFLNPWIYSQGYKGLNDITKGGSTGCTGRSIYSGLKAPYVPYASWNATEGWDPVTGYGTPDFGKLLKLSEGGSYSGRRGLGGRY